MFDRQHKSSGSLGIFDSSNKLRRSTTRPRRAFGEERQYAAASEELAAASASPRRSTVASPPRSVPSQEAKPETPRKDPKVRREVEHFHEMFKRKWLRGIDGSGGRGLASSSARAKSAAQKLARAQVLQKLATKNEDLHCREHQGREAGRHELFKIEERPKAADESTTRGGRALALKNAKKKDKKQPKAVKLKGSQYQSDKEGIFESFEFQKKSAAYSLTDKEINYLTFSGQVTKDLMACHHASQLPPPMDLQ